MPPPYRRNPVRDNRDQFFDEPPQPYYFAPVDRGRTAFGGYAEGGLAAQTSLEMDALNSNRDKAETDRVANITRRLESRSRANILPFSENAAIASAKLQEARAGSDLTNNPFAESANREQLKTQEQEALAEGRLMPLQEQAKAEAYTRQASGEDDWRQHGIDPLTYDFSLRSVDPAVTDPRERQRMAKNAALRLKHDAPYVAAIEEESFAVKDPSIRKKFLKDVIDPETGARFTMLNPEAPPDEVSDLYRKNTWDKQRFAKERQLQQESREDRAMKYKVLDRKRDSYEAMLKDDPTNPDALQKIREIDTQLDALMFKEESTQPAPVVPPVPVVPVAPPQVAAQQVAAPAVTKPTEESAGKPRAAARWR